MKRLFLSILGLIACLNVLAQDPMTDQFRYYQKAKPSSNLFVHFDKNVYSSNETVWFSGYLINTQNIRNHRLMSVSLINENNKIILEDRFIMQDGFSFGNIVLPDSIQPGDYRLLAITDYTINKIPEVSFTQPITIKSILEPPFKASMKVLSNDTKGTKLLVSATTADNRFLAKPVDIAFKYGKVKNMIKTDASGQAIINLEQQEGLTDANLYVKLNYEKDSTSLHMPLPQPKGLPSVQFYPEGGDIVSGLINNIGWEVRDQQKKPIAVKAYVFKNNKVIDTVTSNAYGLGTFKFFAEDGAKYDFKVIANNLKDTLFTLPSAKTNGIVLNITAAVVTDTLKINIRTKQEQQLGLRIHNFRSSYLFTKIDLKTGLRTIKIPLTEVPKGLNTLTITDSENRPLAERIFFAHHDSAEKINIATDKTIYGTREKINLKLKLNDFEDKAIVSVAVVQNDRIDPIKMTDIVSYTFLNNELSSLPKNAKGSIYKDKKYLEQLLLIKGWRRYNWQELASVKPTDTNKNYSNLLLLGNVTKSKKPLNKPVAVGAMGDEKIRLVTTSDNGAFDFNTPSLYTNSGKKMYMFLEKNNDPSYRFAVNNQLLETSSKLAFIPSAEEPLIIPTLTDNSEFFVKSTEKAIRLKEVTITDKGRTKRQFGSNPCGDYVCPYGILNCRNHYGDPNVTQPIPGKTYKINGQSSVYQGCNVTDESIFFKTEGIHIHKDFYVDSYKDPLEPAYFSTIFWKYALVLDKNKEASLDFHTSDIIGKYRIVVQGITQNQVVYNESFFDVKRK